MKLKTIGPNQTAVDINGNTVFFSYETPVAAFVGGEFYRTTKKWSRTTSKHINHWLDGINAAEKPQQFFDNLCSS